MNPSTGIYKHYKSGCYEVIGIARDSETHEEMVVYRAVADSPDFPTGSLWVRPKPMFMENVEVDGKVMPRFRLIEKK